MHTRRFVKMNGGGWLYKLWGVFIRESKIVDKPHLKVARFSDSIWLSTHFLSGQQYRITIKKGFALDELKDIDAIFKYLSTIVFYEDR